MNTLGYYGLAWDYNSFEVRQFLNSELDTFMRFNVHHHVQSVFEGDGKGHFTNVFMRPVMLDPGETRVIYGLVCDGSRAEVDKLSPVGSGQDRKIGKIIMCRPNGVFSSRPGYLPVKSTGSASN